MQVENMILNCDAMDILIELRNQLNANKITLLKDIKDSGDNIMITCPFHKDGQERRPSAGIKKDTGIFHCFTCNTVKSLSEFVSNCFGYDDYGVFGTQWLAKNFSTVSIENRKEIQLDLKRTNSINNSISGDSNKYVSEEELDKYRYYHPYMYKRKLTNEIIDMFDIGYDSATQSITFPVRDIDGNILFIARRSVEGKHFYYPRNAEKPIYGLYELNKYAKNCTEVIVCESMLDALACWVYGKYAVALNGLGTSLQYEQLSNLPCRKLILATDNDSAGRAARTRLRIKIKNKLITEYLIPDGKKDINDLSKEEFDNLKEVF